MESGFSRKSKAPSLVARTAVSMVPWPEIMTTTGRSEAGIFWMRSSASRPSMPGSQMSSRTNFIEGTCERFEAGLAGLNGGDVEAFVLEHTAERLADAGLVVDDQYSGQKSCNQCGDSCRGCRFRLARIIRRRGRDFNSETRPDKVHCPRRGYLRRVRRECGLTMARPRPVPRAFVEK